MCVIDTNSERAIIWIFLYLLLVVVPFAVIMLHSVVNDLAMFDQPPKKWTYRILFRALLYSFLVIRFFDSLFWSIFLACKTLSFWNSIDTLSLDQVYEFGLRSACFGFFTISIGFDFWNIQPCIPLSFSILVDQLFPGM